MNRMKKILALLAVAATLSITMSSCHREGCPNNFKLSSVYEVVQEVAR